MMRSVRFCVPRRKCVPVLLLIGGVFSFIVLLVALQDSVLLLTAISFSSLSNEQLEFLDANGQDPFDLHDNNDNHRTLSSTQSSVKRVNASRDTDLAKPGSDNDKSLASCDDMHIDPKVLFYIRIPKCASTSFVDLLKKVGRSHFELLFDPSGAFNWDKSTTAKVANTVQIRLQRAKRLVYARHFYHVDFKPYGLFNYTYITIIREPISRYVSSYLYYHFSAKPYIQAMLKAEHRNETLLDCMEHAHDGCARNWMTKYFCGNAQFCKYGNDLALHKAKRNLEQDFAAVGILEDMELSLNVFKTVLPKYFAALDVRAEAIKSLNQNERSLDLTVELLAAVRGANSADIELYNFAKELLFQKARACGIKHS